jgi:DNA polymerase/3'-5' exonuclease PolX
MSNAEIARIMREIAIYLDMDGVPFKPRAYEKVAYAIEACDQPLLEMYRRGGFKAICEIPGVGQSIAEKIETCAGPLARTGEGEAADADDGAPWCECVGSVFILPWLSWAPG